MRLRIGWTLVAFGLAALSSAAPTFNPSVSPECAYPIGTGSGENAKVEGRLFKIDGHVKYFAGNDYQETPLIQDLLRIARHERMVARTFKQ